MFGCDIGAPLCDLRNLIDVALTVSTVPDSNATEKRLFSIICKNKTEFCSRLDVASLNAVMIVKMSKHKSLLPCYRWKPTKELLKACKKACTEHNEKYSSTASS